MEKSKNEIVLNVLDVVLEKIEKTNTVIEKRLDFDKGSEGSKILVKYCEFIVRQFNESVKLIKENPDSSQSELLKEIKNISETSNKLLKNEQAKECMTTINKKYFLLGENSQVSIRFIGVIIILLIMLVSSFKYLPFFFSDYNQIKKEKEKYQLIYNYLYFKEFQKKQKNIDYLEALKEKVEAEDENFIEEYYSMVDTYKKAMRRMELERELKALK